MIPIVKSVGATAANRALVLNVWNVNYLGTSPTETNGFFTNADTAAYQIFRADGTQVFPGSGRQALTLTDAPAGARISKGRYVATWAPAIGDAVGAYFVRWFFVRQGAPEETYDQEIELVAAPYSGHAYCTVQDLRDEGLTTGMASDAAAQKMIVIASSYVEHFTGRTFGSQFKSIDIDGTGGRAVQIGEPVIAVSQILLNFVSNFTAQDLLVPGQALKLYNRHITENLIEPDDRENPKIEFVHGEDLAGVNYYESATGYVLYQLMFPRGRRNLKVEGLFGYTEYDGNVNSPGRIPTMLREATKMLVFNNRGKMVSKFTGGAGKAGPIVQESTRDQGVTFQQSWLRGAFTGNSDIDQILAAFVRPPHFGAA